MYFFQNTFAVSSAIWSETQDSDLHPILHKREFCWLNKAFICQEMMISTYLYTICPQQMKTWRQRRVQDTFPSLQSKWTQTEFRIHSPWRVHSTLGLPGPCFMLLIVNLELSLVEFSLGNTFKTKLTRDSHHPQQTNSLIS